MNAPPPPLPLNTTLIREGRWMDGGVGKRGWEERHGREDEEGEGVGEGERGAN